MYLLWDKSCLNSFIHLIFLIIFTDVRTDVLQNGTSNSNPRLNVHAKEFTMKQGDLSTSRYEIYCTLIIICITGLFKKDIVYLNILL